MKHPIQPLELDKNKALRFKSNPIVEHLLSLSRSHGCDLNMLATMKFDQDDRRQFAQLIGYSLSGFSELSYVDDDTYRVVALMAQGQSEDKARIEHLENELKAIREALRGPVARLFGIHPDDLKRNG